MIYKFANCTSLTSVTLSNKLETIESLTFYGCTSLKNITIPASVKTIEHSAFNYSGLEGITLSTGLKTIGAVFFATARA